MPVMIEALFFPSHSSLFFLVGRECLRMIAIGIQFVTLGSDPDDRAFRVGIDLVQFVTHEAI